MLVVSRPPHPILFFFIFHMKLISLLKFFEVSHYQHILVLYAFFAKQIHLKLLIIATVICGVPRSKSILKLNVIQFYF